MNLRLALLAVGVCVAAYGCATPEEQTASPSAAQPRSTGRYLTGSRLVLALILLALVLQVASRVGDYLVAVIFVNATHNDLQALTILLGNAWLASYVVQLVVSLVIAPPQRLVGFARVDLDPGQSKTVQVTFRVSQLAVTPGDIEASGRPQVETGPYQVQVDSLSAGFVVT